MKPHGLAIVIGPAKGKGAPPDDDEEEGSDEEEAGEGSEQEFAEVAFDALKDDDKESFTKALIGTIKACVKNYG